MPVLPTADVIELAKVSQVLALQDIASRKFYNTQVVDKRLPFLLYMERKALEFLYSFDPSSDDLVAMTNYVYWLCGGYITRAQIIIDTPACVPPFILSQPVSLTVDAGNNATFTVSAGGSATLSYQWYKNGIAVSGGTSASLVLTNVDSDDAGNYTVQITNACGTVVSSTAVLTVFASIEVSFWYGTDDPYPALSGGTDDLEYQVATTMEDGGDIEIDIPAPAADFNYNVTRYPTSQAVKDTWYNTAFNNGFIPDSSYQSVVTIGSFYYIISRNTMSFDIASPLIFSTSP